MALQPVLTRPKFASYVVKDDHRVPKWNPAQKSLWTVCTAMENDIFSYGLNSDWWDSRGNVWSFHRQNSEDSNVKMIKLGEDHRQVPKPNPKQILPKDLFVAKFTGDRNACWHGYPVSPITDYPPSEILKKWQAIGVGKKILQKINRGR